MSDSTIILGTVFGVSELIAFVCALHLWRNERDFARVVGWTLVLAIPILGPLVFGAARGGGPGPGDGFPPAPPDNRDHLAGLGHHPGWWP